MKSFDDTRTVSLGRRDSAAPPVSAAATGEILADRFVLREVLGTGATGTVFSALDTSVGQKIAIKVLHPDLHDERTRERLRREVRASRNPHPNSVAVYDLHEADGRLFLSMELIEGRTLKAVMTERGRLDADQVVHVGGQIAAALAHLHCAGVIHRDIKPGNILLTSDGTARLCDMGLARPIEEGMTVTETEMVVGTPAYMAPEQGLGAALTAASDIYGLGLSLYQCLTGSVPLTSDTAVATLARRQRERPPAVRGERGDCPRWLDRLIRRMLEPRPGDRPSAAQVVRAAETGRVRLKPRRRTMIAAGAGLALSAAAVVIPLTLTDRESVRFQIENAEAAGLDAKGRTIWTVPLPADPHRRVVEVDLDGDGRDEILVAGRARQNDSDRSPESVRSYLIALDHRGALVTRLVPEDFIADWSFPYPVEIYPIPYGLDLDHDGIREIVLLCQHTHFYPTMVLVYWPRWDHWESTLKHAGHLTLLEPGSGSGRPGIRFAAVNNALGFSPVYGEIELVPPGNRLDRGGIVSGLAGPPASDMGAGILGAWRAYVPIDEATHGLFKHTDSIVTHPDGSITIGAAGSGVTLDPLGNPVPGPNQGLDLRSDRLEFMRSLGRLAAGSRAVTVDGVNEIIDATRVNAGPLLREPAYRVILGVVGGRALAGAGDPQLALHVLDTLVEDADDEDVLFLRGHLQAVLGDLDRANSTATGLIDGHASSRAHYDGNFLLLQIAIARFDRSLVDSVLHMAGRNAHMEGERRQFRAAMAARARLWWDECVEIDCELTSGSLAPEGDALASLARWRLGRPNPREIETLEASIERNPESAGISRVALAAALLGNNRPQDALLVLDTAIAHLDQSSGFDFLDHEAADLARALQVTAYEASGETQRARAIGQSLGTDLDPRLLPGILVQETSDRINS